MNKVIISCKKHGDFTQRPTDHYRGSGCRKCNISITEGEWLDSMGVKERQKRIIDGDRYFIVDGYDPDTNTVYEYHGDYWHGNPDIFDENDTNKHNGVRFGDLYEETQDREQRIRDLGFNLVIMWESDWLNQKR